MTVIKDYWTKILKNNKVYLAIACFLIILILSSCSRPNGTVKNKVESLRISQHQILHPSFITSLGRLNAGTIFPIKLEDYDKPLLLTATHIFGPPGGLNRRIESKELADFIKNIYFSDAFDGTNVNIKTSTVYIPGAEPGQKYSDKDLAAFIVESDMKIKCFKLCKSNPKIGDHVWLTSSVKGDPNNPKLHEAVVTVSNDRELYFKYYNSKIILHGTSGSPILNLSGEVVGLNVGGLREKGELIGGANPSSSIRRLLEDALK